MSDHALHEFACSYVFSADKYYSTSLSKISICLWGYDKGLHKLIWYGCQGYAEKDWRPLI